MENKKTVIGFQADKWLDDMIILKAKNKGISKSRLIRNIIMEYLAVIPSKKFEATVYYNDEDGILRSRKL